MTTFQALVAEKTTTGQMTQRVQSLPIDRLPANEVLIRVHYSSLNYKDALSATGNPGVTKAFPHIPGIDAAGIVVRSAVPQFQPGTGAIVTGFDLGMNTWGGFAEYISVPAAWVVPLPLEMSLRDSMIWGTAGLTAGLCVEALLRNGVESGEVLVTGATGGVGSLATALLSKLGYRVTAVTGKPDQHDYLRSLGASSFLSREEAVNSDARSLLKQRWAGVVDSVGGDVLATAIKSTAYGGCVTACGLVGGAELLLTVYPFILRGVRLIGIDSANCPLPTRQHLWQKLAIDWKLPNLDAIATSVNLTRLPEAIDRILQGQNIGRVLVTPTVK